MQITSPASSPAVIHTSQAQDTGQEYLSQAEESTDRPAQDGSAMQQVSRLARFAASLQISDLSIQAGSTRFSQTGPGGATLRAESRMNIHTRQEVYRFELDFNAESLGLSKEQLNAFGSKMLQFELTSQQKSMSIRRTIQSSVQKTLRKPAEVIGDLAKALGEVMSKPGNKAVLYELDEEARQAIMGDAKVTELLGELVLIMSAINLQRDANEPATKYLIRVSGKCAPAYQYQQSLSVDEESHAVQAVIRIHPPENGNALGEQAEMLDAPSAG